MALAVFVPSAIYGIGTGAAAPMLPLRALELGASVGTAGVVVAMMGFGLILGDLPAGWLVACTGERKAIALGSCTCAADVAPPGRRAEFLGAWRLTHDIGMFAGPIAVGAISAVTVLGAAAGALAVAGVGGAAAMYRWFPGRPVAPIAVPDTEDRGSARAPGAGGQQLTSHARSVAYGQEGSRPVRPRMRSSRGAVASTGTSGP